MLEQKVVTYQPEGISPAGAILNHGEHDTQNNAVFTLTCFDMWCFWNSKKRVARRCAF